MAIRPDSPTLTFTLSASSISSEVVIGDVSYTFVTEPFERLEYDHNTQLSALNDLGVAAVTTNLLGGRRVQIDVGCGTVIPRPLTPNTSDFDNIYKRFEIKRFNISCLTSSNAAVNAIYTVAVDHQKRLAKFQAHQQKVRGNPSIEFLEQAKLQDFAFLTTTGLTISGDAIDTTENDMLIVAFSPVVELSIPNGSGNDFYKSFSMTLENRVIKALGAD